MMSFRFQICVSLLLIGFLFSVAPAQAAGPQKIGYVDLTRIWSDYHKRTDYNNDFKELREKLENQDRVKTESVQRLTQQIEQYAMGTPDRASIEEKRKAALKEVEDFRRTSHGQLNKKSVEMFAELFSDVQAAVAEAARLGDYDLVLKDQNPEKDILTPDEAVLQIGQKVVLYSKPEYDLTVSVSKSLNEKYDAAKKNIPASETPKPAAASKEK
jgi:Skp family chaperone for outer membrane proteins